MLPVFEYEVRRRWPGEHMLPRRRGTRKSCQPSILRPIPSCGDDVRKKVRNDLSLSPDDFRYRVKQRCRIGGPRSVDARCRRRPLSHMRRPLCFEDRLYGVRLARCASILRAQGRFDAAGSLLPQGRYRPRAEDPDAGNRQIGLPPAAVSAVCDIAGQPRVIRTARPH